MIINGVDMEYMDTKTINRNLKANEKVMVIPSEIYYETGDLIYCIGSYSAFKKRGTSKGDIKGVETDPIYKQVIPYYVFIKDDKILCYLKSKKSGETRLHGLYSVGIGGHINEKDGKGLEAVKNAAIRECREEIGITPVIDDNEDYILIDFGNGVSDFHVGLCRLIRNWEGQIKLSDEVQKVDWLTLEELEARKPLESWTEHLLQRGVFGGKRR